MARCHHWCLSQPDCAVVFFVKLSECLLYLSICFDVLTVKQIALDPVTRTRCTAKSKNDLRWRVIFRSSEMQKHLILQATAVVPAFVCYAFGGTIAAIVFPVYRHRKLPF